MELGDLDEEILFGDQDDQIVPPSLRTTSTTMDIAFHPTLPLLAAGLVTGEVELFHNAGGGSMVKKPLENDFSSWIFGDDHSAAAPHHGGQHGKQRRLRSSSSAVAGPPAPLYRDTDVVIQYRHGNLQMHPYGAVSGIEFTDDGAYLVTSSSDRTISVLDCATSKLLIHLTADTILSKTAKSKKAIVSHKKRNSSRSRNQYEEDEDDKDSTMKDRHGKRGPKGMDAKGRLDTPLLQDGHPVSPAWLEKKKKKKKMKDSAFLVTQNPHQYGISALNVCDENLVATGDDDGLVAIWDMRTRQPAFVYHEHGDYISQLLYFSDVQELVSSSGDTCLGVYDVRGGKIRDYSEKRKDEILSFAFIQSSGVSSTFIPSVLCGTTNGSLPLWKFGSWRRPYDVLEGHPGEVEAVVAFHGEESSFNHNIVLTGACDGVIRVMEMYPLRRTLCHISVRDTVQGSEFHCTQGSRYKREHLAIRRERGSEAIRRIRVSHDGALVAASGYDAIVDFADIRFLNSEKELDALRRKREQRHMQTLREVEREQHAKEEGEAEEEEDDSEDESCDDEDSVSSLSSEPVKKKVKKERGDDSSKPAPFPVSKTTKSEIAKKKEATRPAVDSEDSSDEEDKSQRGRGSVEATQKEALNSTKKRSEKDGSKEKSAERKKKNHLTEANNSEIDKKEKTTKKKKATTSEATDDNEDKTKKNKREKEEIDWMEEYKTDRQKKREQAAAARWLKEEKKKKVNFTYEKRRRRVGGFFADLQGD